MLIFNRNKSFKLKVMGTLRKPLKPNIFLQKLLREIFLLVSWDYNLNNWACMKTLTKFFKFYFSLNIKQETLCVVTIAMICSTLASLWKSQYFKRPIYNAVEDLWWSLYCENIRPLSIFTKKLHCRCSHGF